MTDPQRPDPGPPQHPVPNLPSDSRGLDSETPESAWAAPAEEPRRWSRRAIAGTGLLIALFVAVGVFAALTVTPGPDEEALARPGDTDIVIAGAAPLSWDPAVANDTPSAQMLAQVYEGLTALDADSELRPALAESWSVEDEGRRLVFELREDLTFSDGTALTADDVRRSWLRVIDPAHPSPLSSLLDDVAGAAAYARGEGSREEVGLQADERRLIVDFERPAAYFPAVVAAPTLAVVPEGIDEQAGGPNAGQTFTSSGAYVPIEQDLDQVRLEGNPAYWAGAPSIERVTVITDDGGRSNVDIFEDGAVDWTPVGPNDAEWIRYDRNLGPQLHYTDEMAVRFLGFDTTTAPFDDPAVRRAIAMAVDWKGLASLGGGSALPPTSIVPPGVAGRGDDDQVLPYDPDAARAELAAAGYPAGEGFPSVGLSTYGIGPAAAIAADLGRELGIEVRVENRPFDDHWALIDGDSPAMWTVGWSADYPHAHDFLGLLLRTGSSVNLGGWSDARFDGLVDAAAATGDPDEQSQLYREAEAILRDEVPLIPLSYSSNWWLSRDGLQGGQVSGVGIVRLAEMAWAE